MKNHSSASLQTLFRTQQLWCANNIAPATQGQDTGYAALNAVLHSGGWPQAGLIELLSQQSGIGELQLLLPIIRATQQSGRYTVFSNTPHTLYVPALHHANITADKLLLLKPLSKTALLWALEQSLRSGSCGAVVSWLAQQHLRSSELRRLQLAAQQGNCLLFLYRSIRCQQQASPAKLRLVLSSKQQSLCINILKQPGGWAGQSATIAQTQHAHSYISPRQLPYVSSRQAYKNLATNTAAQPQTIHPISRLNA